jgi:hypothetical protein
LALAWVVAAVVADYREHQPAMLKAVVVVDSLA